VKNSQNPKNDDFESCSNLKFILLLRFLVTKICFPSSLSYQTPITVAQGWSNCFSIFFTDVKYLAILKVARIINLFYCSDSLWLKYPLRQVLAIKPNNCGAGTIQLIFNIFHRRQIFSDFESCSILKFFSMLRFLLTKICFPSSLSYQTQ
jgi:hypothetical protein